MKRKKIVPYVMEGDTNVLGLYRYFAWIATKVGDDWPWYSEKQRLCCVRGHRNKQAATRCGTRQCGKEN